MANTIFEQTGGNYTQVGDYMLPDLSLLAEEETNNIVVWAMSHKRYLKQNHKVLYYNLLTSGKLNNYLADIESQAQHLFSRLVKDLAEKENITEELKAENQMIWVQKVNNIRNRATEIVNAVNCSILLAVYCVYHVREMERNRTAYTTEREKCVSC